LDISVCNAAIMPAGYGIGNHHLFVINFAESDVIGISHRKVVRPTSWRLNTKIPRVAAEYARILEEKVLTHRLIERMGRAHQKANPGPQLEGVSTSLTRRSGSTCGTRRGNVAR
jgi:hypothetical protein